MAYDDLTAGLPDRDAGRRAVTAFFDTHDAADIARLDLIRAGIPAEDVRVAGGEAAEAAPLHEHSFWASLRDFFLPEEDRHLYAEGLRRGGFAVSVQTDGEAYDRVLEILDRDGAVDMEERSAGWRDEGWSGTPASFRSDLEPIDERALTPAGSGTAGFGASMADQPLFDPPIDTSVIEPGLVTPGARAGDTRIDATAPDTAYQAAAPGVASPASSERDSTALPGMLQPAPRAAPLKARDVDALSEAPLPTRDLSHGRTRVRSYTSDPSSSV